MISMESELAVVYLRIKFSIRTLIVVLVASMLFYLVKIFRKDL